MRPVSNRRQLLHTWLVSGHAQVAGARAHLAWRVAVASLLPHADCCRLLQWRQFRSCSNSSSQRARATAIIAMASAGLAPCTVTLASTSAIEVVEEEIAREVLAICHWQFSSWGGRDRWQLLCMRSLVLMVYAARWLAWWCRHGNFRGWHPIGSAGAASLEVLVCQALGSVEAQVGIPLHHRVHQLDCLLAGLGNDHLEVCGHELREAKANLGSQLMSFLPLLLCGGTHD
mmetsp:Transcript_35971/g.84274  ORF Transcript_35971/g.84274 Transcript_35971/m.84274 type:complete len:230 (+) Transcript_35971:455-1144(+)